jgi:hypothetical protein
MNRPHRDLPLEGIGVGRVGRSREEREADYFAACYLIPRKILLDEFEARFGPLSDFRFSDEAAFGLQPNNYRQLLACEDDELAWESALSTAFQYHGSRHFSSLTEVFRVSQKTMAIRLREVGLKG